jgi:hypothetical protein
MKGNQMSAFTHTAHKVAAATPAKAIPAGPTPMQSGGIINSSSPNHNATVQAAEMTRQASVAAATNQSQLNAAARAFHVAVAKSAIANGCSPEPSMTALRSLGQTGI